jgi:amino acid transporter
MDKDRIGFWGAVAIGIGGMVGGGIFAVLGLSVQLARGAAPVAFALAGAVALLTARSYARLSVAYPSQGGTVTFLFQAFGPGLFTGTANVLLWISYIVMLALYAHAFGSYGALLFPAAHRTLWMHALISTVIVAITVLNLFSVRVIGAAERWIVAIKIAILAVFVGLGVMGMDTHRLAPSEWAPWLPVVAGGMIIFVAYEGFELIANAAEDVRDPARTLPRAFYACVGFVIVLYLAVAMVTLGNLSIPGIIAAQDYALAEAARPFLGSAGYLVITIAALLSTTSAINATLYGAARLSYTIARDGELPRFLERCIWNRPAEGLLLTAALTLVLANSFDLSNISTMGSTGFLLIFAAVNVANARLAATTGARPWLSWTGAAACLAALGCLLVETAIKHPAQLTVLAVMLGLALAIEWSYRRWRDKPLHLPVLARRHADNG